MPSAIDTHPQRQKILDALLNSEKPESIAQWVQPALHRVTIWRYWRDKVQPTLAGKASVLKALENRGLLKPEQSAEISAEVATSATKQALLNEPIYDAIAAKRARFAQVYESSTYKGLLASGRMDTDVENAETQALRFEAQLRAVGGFSPQHQANTASHVTLVVLPQLPGATQQPARIEAQDVEFRALPEASEGPTEPDK